VTADTIFVARHGVSELNDDGRISGQIDASLADQGREQARALATVLRVTSLAGIYTSALRRTIETAGPVASAQLLDITRCADLNEMSHGSAEGRYRDSRDPEIQALLRQRDADRLGFAMPGGENFFDLRARVAACLHRIVAAHDGGNVLIVGHRNVNRVLLAELLDRPLDEMAATKIRNKYLYEIKVASRDVRTIALSEHKLGTTYEGLRT